MISRVDMRKQILLDEIQHVLPGCLLFRSTWAIFDMSFSVSLNKTKISGSFFNSEFMERKSFLARILLTYRYSRRVSNSILSTEGDFSKSLQHFPLQYRYAQSL